MTYEVQQITLCDGWVNTWTVHHGVPYYPKPQSTARSGRSGPR